MPKEAASYKPQDLINKEAKGKGNANLGEVKDVNHEYVITEKGLIDKDRYYIPKDLIDTFDMNHVWFGITEDEAKQYKRD
jgi:hypothetical protein